VHEFPRRVEGDVQHEVTGKQPKGSDGEDEDNDSRPVRSLSTNTHHAAPQEQDRHSCRYGEKDTQEERTRFHEVSGGESITCDKPSIWR
jgi:hypothetical protein